MKKLFIYLMFSMTFALTACSDDDEITMPEYLPVTYANIAGTWQLKEWHSEELGEGRYCYLVINRKANDDGNRTLEMYMNLDSDKSHRITSVYELSDDDEVMDEDPTNAIISGIYDHSAGFWNNSYLVNQVDANRMVWTVIDDAEDVSVYVRCESVPEDILAGTRALE